MHAGARNGRSPSTSPIDLAATGRFVIVDNFEISGGGIVREALPDNQAWVREKVLRRNYKWQAGGVSTERRAERYSQKPTLLLITGDKDADRKALRRASSKARLFDEGRYVYFLGIGNVLYGVDADIDRSDEHRPEHLRRLGEVANILLDAGLIVIATAVGVTQEDVEVIATAVGSRPGDRRLAGRSVTHGPPACDLSITTHGSGPRRAQPLEGPAAG